MLIYKEKLISLREISGIKFHGIKKFNKRTNFQRILYVRDYEEVFICNSW
jgi:hypothetical protein